MSKFYLPSSTATSTANTSPILSPGTLDPRYRPSYSPAIYASDLEEDEDESTLPFPTPLPRSAFLDPEFSPQSYLSSLRNRHQTLEDLRSDLRTRVQELSKELFDLVNSEYEDFLSVGSTLKGGDDRIEEVRVGVLGFRREVEGVREKVKARGEEVKELLEERRGVRRDVALGRRLLDVDERISELEGRLGITELNDEDEDDDDEDEDEDESDPLVSVVNRLRRHALLYLQIDQVVRRVGTHPFLDGLQGRIAKTKSTLLLDLSTALKQSKAKGKDGSACLLKIVAIYRELGEASEAIRVFKST